MYERTRFGTTPHSQKVVQDSDAYGGGIDGEIKAARLAVDFLWLISGLWRATREGKVPLFPETATKSISLPAPCLFQALSAWSQAGRTSATPSRLALRAPASRLAALTGCRRSGRGLGSS